jgi:hypothetical protein
MSATNRNKTLRKPQVVQDVSGIDYSINESLEKMLEQEAGSMYKRPWHRLERGLRLNRLRIFSETLGKTRGLKATEQTALFQMLAKALDKKLLNSKTAVVYDSEKEEITEIKPLVMHQTATGEVLFQLLERRNAVTFRKRPTTPPPSSAGEGSKP